MSSARKSTTLAAGLLGVVLLTAGCGGSSSPGVAYLSTARSLGNTSSEGGNSSPGSQANPQQQSLAFAECMRADGVPNFPDPTAGGGLFRLRAGTNPSSPAFKAAQAQCRKLMPGGGPPGPGSSTDPSPQTLAHYLKVAQCMRKHGISEFPDPRTSVPSNPFGSGYGVISDIEGVIFLFPQRIGQQSPAFTRAAAACAFPLHNH
jgi:hypothetical protein